MDDVARIRINKEWKDEINQEKSQTETGNYHQPTFSIFLSSLSMQAMIAMGKLENPLTKKTTRNYSQARFLIETLEIVKEKTKSNINAQEKKLLNESLTNLKLIYLEVKK
ncbi:MAG: DUF1844 domain-containing protein [Omnitrophica bacterium]|nr:DUF1844 domain-containing protein [Candidatus Omnitrophota bacterium]